MLTRHEFQPRDEAPRPDDHVHRRVRPVHVGEDPHREAHLPVDVEVETGVVGQQLVERRRVAHVDHPERWVVRDPQVQLPLARRQIDDVQASLAVEQAVTQIGVELRSRLRKLVEPSGEVVLAGVAQQSGPALQQPRDHRAHSLAVRDHPAEKPQNADDVGSSRPIRLARPRYRLAEENPQRLSGIERLPVGAPVAPDAALLVERQQAAEQVHVAVLVLGPPREVRDCVVLAIAVVVEPPIGVVEKQALAVGVQKAGVLAAHHLIERGRVLEREPAPRQLPPTLAPDLARRAQVSLVDQHQVVVAEVRHRHPLHALLLGQLVQVDDLHRLEQVRRRLAGEQPRVEPARVHLALVLRRHLLVGGQQHDVVEPASRPIEVVPVLQDVRVHEQRLAGAGGALEGQNPQVIRRVRRQGRRLPPQLPREIQIAAQRPPDRRSSGAGSAP